MGGGMMGSAFGSSADACGAPNIHFALAIVMGDLCQPTAPIFQLSSSVVEQNVESTGKRSTLANASSAQGTDYITVLSPEVPLLHSTRLPPHDSQPLHLPLELIHPDVRHRLPPHPPPLFSLRFVVPRRHPMCLNRSSSNSD